MCFIATVSQDDVLGYVLAGLKALLYFIYAFKEVTGIIDGDGTAMITIDDNVVNKPYSFDELQKMKDADDLKRLKEAKAQYNEDKPEKKDDKTSNVDLSKITNDNGNIVIVDVIGQNGNAKYPSSEVFLISNDGKKAKVMEMDEEGNLKPHAVDKKDIVEISTMSLDEYKQTLPSSNIEENRGEIEMEEPTETAPITDEEADAIIADMESRAEPAADIPLTPENWEKEFGEDGTVQTPIGEVKMGENQIAKLFLKGRDAQLGMIKPTLTNPDAIIEITSGGKEGEEVERETKLLFVKTFLNKNGKKIHYFTSVTVRKEGMEVSISNHIETEKRIRRFLKEGKLLYRVYGGAQTEQTQPSASVTTSQEGNAGSFEGKGNNNSAENNENNETLTLEDGTVTTQHPMA